MLTSCPRKFDYGLKSSPAFGQSRSWTWLSSFMRDHIRLASALGPEFKSFAIGEALRLAQELQDDNPQFFDKDRFVRDLMLGED